MEKLALALAFIDAHLEQAFSLNDVARSASLSPYHFARSFRAVFGETVMTYTRRRRLLVAAKRLLDDESVSIIHLAIASGFDSQAAFTRAFKKQFGLPPGAWRNLDKLTALTTIETMNQIPSYHQDQEQKMIKPVFKSIKTVNIIGMMRVFNDNNKHQIPALWQDFIPRLGEIEAIRDACTYGICFPNALDDGFPYMAGVAVDSITTIPNGMMATTLHGGQTYAVFTHQIGTDSIHEGLQKTLKTIWGQWLPQSEFETAKAADFEYYDDRFDPINAKGEFDIYVPIQPKSIS